MAKTYEAMIKAEEEAQKKQADRGLSSSPGRGPSTVDRGLPLPDRGPSTVDRGLPLPDRGLPLDEYYRLKLNILRANPDGKIKSLLFLSPTGGEGATTVLVEFAMALAGQGEKVLLVDANFRSPSLHQQFHLEMENGLTDLLLGKAKLSEVIQKTSLDTLWVITVGTLHRGPSTVDRRLFPSNALDPHLQKMKEEADWVLFDAPPVNHFDEGLALSGKVDGVVMVLQAEKTRWEVAQSAKQRLENSGGKILGVVLNKRKFYIPKWLYRTL
jgi:capsular exopolysaccharide synthesis family protein